MNTANLQIEGLLLAVSRLLEALRRKGVLTQQEIDAALKEAEDAATRDAASRNISAAQAEGMVFPIRVLLTATNLEDGTVPTFTDLACMIGEGRGRHG